MSSPGAVKGQKGKESIAKAKEDGARPPLPPVPDSSDSEGPPQLVDGSDGERSPPSEDSSDAECFVVIVRQGQVKKKKWPKKHVESGSETTRSRVGRENPTAEVIRTTKSRVGRSNR